MGFRAQILLALVLWPYGSWLTLYYLKRSVSERRGVSKSQPPPWLPYTSVIPLLIFAFSMYVAFRTRPSEASWWIFLAIGVFVVTKGWASKARSGVLGVWAASIPLSSQQKKACDELWKALREGRIPKPDPLSFLTKQDHKTLMRFCTIEYRPELFGRNPKAFDEKTRELSVKGYNEDQSKVLTGMIFNRVGRA